MGLPEILRKEADRLLDRASLESNWEREQEFMARAAHLYNRAGMLEGEDDPEQTRIRLEIELEQETDPIMQIKIQAAIDNLTEREP
jgi:hypothetical protein